VKTWTTEKNAPIAPKIDRAGGRITTVVSSIGTGPDRR